MKVVPEMSPVARSPRPARILHRTALGLVAVAAIAGVVTTVSVTQQAMADELDRQLVTASLTETASVHAEQLDAYSGVLAARTDYAERVAAAEAAEAAYLVTPAGAQQTARSMAATQYGWGDDQFGCLVNLWNRESGWSVNALNESSGATGIPQALPGDKMAIAGDDWQTNPATQIAWGLSYISSGYGTPCAAWNHSESNNWY